MTIAYDQVRRRGFRDITIDSEPDSTWLRPSDHKGKVSAWELLTSDKQQVQERNVISDARAFEPSSHPRYRLSHIAYQSSTERASALQMDLRYG